MKQSFFKIIGNEKIAERSWRMRLEGDMSQISGSGQFVQVCLPGFYLRRPISVCSLDGDVLTLVYRVVGKGTEAMSGFRKGDSIELITGLGHGFDPEACAKSALLVGGGCGIAPLYELAKELFAMGKDVTAILGFNNEAEIMLAEEFKALGANVIITTADGSVGVKGFVTDAIRSLNPRCDYFYTCGPRVMMKAVSEMLSCSGEVSLEEKMGCGFGICFGCSIQTAKGPKQVCKDGPVFKKEDVIW